MSNDDEIALFGGMDEATEAESERDGAFSYAAEWHSFTIGFYSGFSDFKDWGGLPEKARENRDVKAEPHYAKGGYMVGAAARIVVMLALGAGAAVQFL